MAQSPSGLDHRFGPDIADQIAQPIRRALAEAPVRVRMLDTPMGRLWLKRVERLSLRWALQKGGARRSFEKDRRGLRLLGKAGLPVAPIVAEGRDFFVTPDLGTTLRLLLDDPAVPLAERSAAFTAAGRALAVLHLSGFSHGRPAVRDLCWDGAEIRFIDMEKFSPRKCRPRHLAADILVFLHSVFAAGGALADAETAITAYRAKAGPAAWGPVVRLARRLGPLGAAAAWASVRKPHSRSLKAVPRTLACVAAAG